MARGFLARKYVHRLRKVSEQHKVYVKSFLLGVQTNSEMFLTNQTVVIQHEIKERERKAGELCALQDLLMRIKQGVMYPL